MKMAPLIPIQDKVPIRSKLAYGAAGAVDTWATSLPGHLMTPIYVVALGLSPAWIGIAIFVFRIWDAGLDLLMGWISDNTRTRWGRRRPYLVIGAILTGLWFPVMWFAPESWPAHSQFAWLIVSGLVLYVLFSSWAMPYQSLLLEMTPNYYERTSVSSYRTIFQQIAGLVIGWSWYVTELPIFTDAAGKPNALHGAQGLSVLVGILIIVIGVLPGFFVKERFYKAASHQAKVSLRDSLRWTFTNRPFLIMLGFTIFFAGGLFISIGLSFYVRLYYVTGGNAVEAAKLVGIESVVSAIVGFLAVPAFQWLSNRHGKTRVLGLAVVISILTMATKWWMFTPVFPRLSIVNSLFLGLAGTGIWQLIPSMNADIIDNDELRTGERREGAFAAVYSWVIKASISLGTALAGGLTVWCGFKIENGTTQSAAAIHNLRICYAFLPMGLLAIALVILTKYELTPQRIEATRNELEARRGKL